MKPVPKPSATPVAPEAAETHAMKPPTQLRTYFLAGLLVTLPLAVTYLLLRWMFAALDAELQPFSRVVLGRRIPGLGIIVGVGLIVLAGAIANNVAGRQLFAWLDRLMLRIPLARPIYGATKQMTDAILGGQRAAFQRVVLVEWPRHGAYTIGFVTGEYITNGNARLLSVFIVSTPNPTTGFLMIVPESGVLPLDMSVEDGLKLVLSGGIAGALDQAARALGRVGRQ